MHSLTTTLRSIGFLTIALTLALIANFAYGQWTNPSQAPTGGNVSVPIHTGGGTQTKAGTIEADQAVATNQAQSDLYCDYSGTNCFRACEVTGTCAPTYSNCTLDGVTVNHGSSRTFYSLTSTTGSCTSYDQIRTCNDGTLNGSTAFRHRSCTTVAPTYSNCSVNGVPVAHGSGRTFYTLTSTTGSCSSYSQYRTCSNGTMSGSTAYQYASCSTVAPPPPPVCDSRQGQSCFLSGDPGTYTCRYGPDGRPFYNYTYSCQPPGFSCPATVMRDGQTWPLVSQFMNGILSSQDGCWTGTIQCNGSCQ